MVLNIISLNVRGLGDANKRRTIFNYYRPKCDVLCLQETHSTEECSKVWTNEWGGRAMFAHGTSTSRGCAILVKKSARLEIVANRTGQDGRMVACTVIHENKKINIVNIYGPNQDNPEFFEQVATHFRDKCENLIVIGDFNTVMNQDLDRNTQQAPRNVKANNKIKSLCEEMMLQDIWRSQNGDTRRYSWYRSDKRANSIQYGFNNIQASRLDYALMSVGMCNMVHNCFYFNGICTDHSAFFLGIDITQQERGPGFWKLNCQLLSKKEILDSINKLIDKIVNKTDESDMSSLEKWEYCKEQVRIKFKALAKQDADDDKIAVSQLAEQVTELESRVTELSESENTLLYKSKEDLEELLFKRTKSVMFRSKAKWYMEGEQNTKYFYSLEKSRYNAKTCTAIFNKEGIITTDATEIIELQRQFYQELYTHDPSTQFQMENVLSTKAEGISASEDHFTEHEVTVAIKGMKNNSCPGSDGLPAEFYKVFWGKIKVLFMAVVRDAYQDRLLHRSARKGVLNLIPKGNKDTRVLQNLRPITLLNADYKIIEKLIANRMMCALEVMIHQDQTGFIPNRRIAANIRKILDAIQCEEHKEEDPPTIILSCDYVKCFDRVELAGVLGAMEQFGFSRYLRTWVEIIYTEFTLKVQNNGFFSSNVDATRGLHQGGPASNAIFLTVAELLACNLRRNVGTNIRGLYVKDILQFLNQFADDMDVCMKDDGKSLQYVVRCINEFGASTGFALNYDKTTVYRVDSSKNSIAKKYTETEFKWTVEGINVLGVEITVDEDELIRRNYNPLIQKTQNILNQWSHRTLSLVGKVNVVNTLVASIYVYKMSILSPLPKEYIIQINRIVEDYLWNKRRPKISLKTLQNLKTGNGLGLVNFEVKDAALKAAWVKTLVSGQYQEELVNRFIQPQLGRMIWTCNLRHTDVEKAFPRTPAFWREVLKAWCRYHYTDAKDDKRCEQIVWFNSNIKAGGAPLWMPKPAASGLMYVSQLYENSSLITPKVANERYSMSTMEYNTVVCALPREYKEKGSECNDADVYVDPKYAEYMKADKTVAHVYKNLVENSPGPTQAELKWAKILNMPVSINSAIRCVWQATLVAKLRSFQYRLLMHALVTNIELKRWGKREEDLCSFCGSYTETYEHLFVMCDKIQNVWIGAQEVCQSYGENLMTRNAASILLNHNVNSKLVTTVMTITKQYIYAKRCMQLPLSKQEIKAKIIEYRNIELYYAKQKRYHKVARKWKSN